MRTTIRILMTIALLTTAVTAVAQDWEARNSGSSSVLNGVRFVDAERGFAVGDAGTILATEDGGSTWVALALTVAE